MSYPLQNFLQYSTYYVHYDSAQHTLRYNSADKQSSS
jgi:hypothetical protein